MLRRWVLTYFVTFLLTQANKTLILQKIVQINLKLFEK